MSTEITKKEIWVTDFNSAEAQKFRDAVMLQHTADPTAPIIIYIDSYGGTVDALAKMIATIDEVSNPIITVCMGKAMSCGAFLLAHGDVRFCDQHSRIMIHEVSAGTGGDIHDMKADVKEIARLNEYFVNMLAVNCGYKGYNDIRKLIKEQDGRDRFMTATDAVEFGIVDCIGLPKVTSVTVHEVTYQKPEGVATKKKAKKTKVKPTAQKTETKK